MQSAASNRSFGLILAAVFLVVAALSYWAHGHFYPYWAGVGAGLLAIAILTPRVLAPLKRLWLRLGHFLHLVVAPVVLGLTYVAAIVPVGLLTRIFGKDLLAQRWNRSAPSYWRKRPARGPAPESLRDQF